MIPVDDAVRMWRDAIGPLEAEDVDLRDAYGRVAAGPVAFTLDLPPFSNSAMDGFAIRRADAGGTLKIAGEAAAGRVWEGTLRTGEAVRIMTGSPVPAGADTIVPVENVEEADGAIRVVTAPEKGAHIRPAGDDVRAGDPILETGDVVGYGELAALSSSGIMKVKVARKPRVAVLTTGDEVVPPDADPPPGKIRDCNLILQRNLLERRGVVLLDAAHVPDDLEAMSAWLRSVLDPQEGRPADLVVTTGGVSVGRYDFVRPLLAASGFREIFWRVRMRPGKPVVTARREGDPPAYACGLPGNPVSAFVGTLLWVMPALDRLEGRRSPSSPWLRARFDGASMKAGPRTVFSTARVRGSADGLVAEPLPRQGSHRISTLLKANGLVRVEAGSRVERGDDVTVLVWAQLH